MASDTVNWNCCRNVPAEIGQYNTHKLHGLELIYSTSLKLYQYCKQLGDGHFTYISVVKEATSVILGVPTKAESIYKNKNKNNGDTFLTNENHNTAMANRNSSDIIIITCDEKIRGCSECSNGGTF